MKLCHRQSISLQSTESFGLGALLPALPPLPRPQLTISSRWKLCPDRALILISITDPDGDPLKGPGRTRLSGASGQLQEASEQMEGWGWEEAGGNAIEKSVSPPFLGYSVELGVGPPNLTGLRLF